MPDEPSELKRIPLAEKLRPMEALWNETHSAAEVTALPEQLLEEIDRRAAEVEADPTIAIDEEELWRRVDAATGR